MTPYLKGFNKVRKPVETIEFYLITVQNVSSLQLQNLFQNLFGNLLLVENSNFMKQIIAYAILYHGFMLYGFKKAF